MSRYRLVLAIVAIAVTAASLLPGLGGRAGEQAVPGVVVSLGAYVASGQERLAAAGHGAAEQIAGSLRLLSDSVIATVSAAGRAGWQGVETAFETWLSGEWAGPTRSRRADASGGTEPATRTVLASAADTVAREMAVGTAEARSSAVPSGEGETGEEITFVDTRSDLTPVPEATAEVVRAEPEADLEPGDLDVEPVRGTGAAADARSLDDGRGETVAAEAGEAGSPPVPVARAVMLQAIGDDGEVALASDDGADGEAGPAARSIEVASAEETAGEAGDAGVEEDVVPGDPDEDVASTADEDRDLEDAGPVGNEGAGEDEQVGGVNAEEDEDEDRGNASLTAPTRRAATPARVERVERKVRRAAVPASRERTTRATSSRRARAGRARGSVERAELARRQVRAARASRETAKRPAVRTAKSARPGKRRLASPMLRTRRVCGVLGGCRKVYVLRRPRNARELREARRIHRRLLARGYHRVGGL
ncbi:MAG: hypothetical protein R3D33_07845 [Hyphomicrobiaceae bacterium]